MASRCPTISTWWMARDIPMSSTGSHTMREQRRSRQAQVFLSTLSTTGWQDEWQSLRNCLLQMVYKLEGGCYSSQSAFTRDAKLVWKLYDNITTTTTKTPRRLG